MNDNNKYNSTYFNEGRGNMEILETRHVFFGFDSPKKYSVITVRSKRSMISDFLMSIIISHIKSIPKRQSGHIYVSVID